MWNPVPSAWIQAIEAGFFAAWPGLASELMRKHLELSIEATKGRLRADRKNVRSAKIKLNNKPESPKRQNEFCTKLIDLNGKTRSYQTGRFPFISSRGHKRVMVVCDHDANAMLAEPLKSKAATEHLAALKKT